MVRARAQVRTEISKYVRNFENEVNQAFLKYFPVQVFRFIIRISDNIKYVAYYIPLASFRCLYSFILKVGTSSNER